MLELFFPARCAICNNIGTFLCEECSSDIVYIKIQTCPGCNRDFPSGRYCPRCRPNKNLSGLVAAAYFKNENTKILVHELKYRGYFAIAPTLAQEMVNALGRKRFDYIVPVPVSRKRLRKRGYNQSEELALGISELTSLVMLKGLRKVRETKPQVGLKKKEREGNLKEAFHYRGKDINKKTILLVDDVKTTGATLEACAKELKKAGAKSVWGIVFAKE